jgi:predicted metal-dependent enzyme (double-stranded beta helix superfamily)
MTADRYSIPQLVADLRRIRAETADEHRLLAAVRPLALRAAEASDLWLEDRMLAPDPEQGFSLFPLSEEPDHTLAVFAFSWLPGRGTPPHDHGTWAVVAGVLGAEKNVFWRRRDDGTRPDHADLERVGTKVFERGQVLAMPTGVIHEVRNETDAVTVSLHMYGIHINHTGRSKFDPESRTASPYVSRIEC